MHTRPAFGCVIEACSAVLRQDAVVARQYISDLRAFEQQARSWTGSLQRRSASHVREQQCRSH